MGGTRQDQTPQHTSEGLTVPTAPSEEERRIHELTHADPQPWCYACVAGKSRGHLHTKQDPTAKQGNVVQLDYTYWSAAGIAGVGPERRALTSLTATHESTGYCLATVVERKGPWPFAVANIVKMVKDTGLQHEGKVILRGDAEPSLMALLAAVRK